MCIRVFQDAYVYITPDGIVQIHRVVKPFATASPSSADGMPILIEALKKKLDELKVFKNLLDLSLVIMLHA